MYDLQEYEFFTRGDLSMAAVPDLESIHCFVLERRSREVSVSFLCQAKGLASAHATVELYIVNRSTSLLRRSHSSKRVGREVNP